MVVNLDLDRIYQIEMTIYRLLHRLHLSSKYFGKNQRHNLLIDYFLVDHIIRLIYENNDSVKNEIDKLAIVNPDIFFFQGNNTYQKYNEEEWKLLKLRNQFFKCNWKCREKQVDGSFYDTILLKRLNK